MLQQINTSVSHFALILYIIFGLISAFKARRDRALSLLALTMFITAASYIRQVLSTYDVFVHMGYTFTPVLLLWGVSFSALYCLYSIEISRPSWLDAKFLLLFLSPVFLMLLSYVVAAVLNVHWRIFESPADIFSYIHEFNVQLRLLFFMGSLLYSFAGLYTLYVAVKNRTLPRLFISYAVVFMANVMIYGFMAFCGIIELVLVHKICYLIFNAALMYFAISYHNQDELNRSYTLQSCNGIDHNKEEFSLSERLLVLMEEEKPWLDPQLTQPGLAAMLYTNRTTLSGVIRDMGYRNFQEFINYYRIEEFKKIVSEEKIVNIQETFYRVGFRSKSTAFRCFSRFENVTPFNYLQQQGSDS